MPDVVAIVAGYIKMESLLAIFFANPENRPTSMLRITKQYHHDGHKHEQVGEPITHAKAGPVW